MLDISCHVYRKYLLRYLKLEDDRMHVRFKLKLTAIEVRLAISYIYIPFKSRETAIQATASSYDK